MAGRSSLKKWISKKGVRSVLLSMAIALLPQPSFAGMIELSGSFAFSQSNFGNAGFQWTRRLGLSVGYYFLSLTEIEFSVQDILYRTKISTVEDTTFHDQIYSIEWVQSFTQKSSGFQPYTKLGVGQLNREASGTYWGGRSSTHTLRLTYSGARGRPQDLYSPDVRSSGGRSQLSYGRDTLHVER